MKQLLIIIILGISLLACQKSADKNNGLVGKWQLSEYLADPGDGSGTWQKATALNSGSIEFKSDGSLILTGMNPVNTRDRYLVESNNKIVFIKGTDSVRLSYQLIENLLNIYPPCIESCGFRYKAID